MVKSLIARFSRWLRKTSDKYCTLDIDKDARGLAKCLVHKPLTAEEKAERRRESILRNAHGADRDKAIKHFQHLSSEVDPHEGNKEICDDSVKKVGVNLSVDEIAKRFGEVDHERNLKRAENAIKGVGSWPSPKPVPRKCQDRCKGESNG